MVSDRTEYHRKWRANNPEKMDAARRRYRQKHPYVPRVKPNPTGRLITVRQEQIYRLVHPDFYNLPYWAAAKLMGICTATVCNELKRIKKVCPTLFPIRDKLSSRTEVKRRLELYGNLRGLLSQPVSYKKWMDNMIVEKF
jgi:hypothetical protein